MTILAIALIILSAPLFNMGIGSLKNSAHHAEYGVDSQHHFKIFSWGYIILAILLACSGGWLLAG